ncbi:MAG TPA: hypothetical protein VLB07_14485 [Woeseiaceae bacterium]|nr:hypothetical protein [Woeseiaceae bacterium]
MNNSVGTPHSAVLRRIGAAGFAFFLVKGLLWLAAPFIFLMFT